MTANTWVGSDYSKKGVAHTYSRGPVILTPMGQKIVLIEGLNFMQYCSWGKKRCPN